MDSDEDFKKFQETVRLFREIESRFKNKSDWSSFTEMFSSVDWNSFSPQKAEEFQKKFKEEDLIWKALDIFVQHNKGTVVQGRRVYKKINSKELIGLLPDLTALSFKAENEIIKDSDVSLSWDGEWKSQTKHHHTKKPHMNDIYLSSKAGNVLLKKPFWTSWGGGDISGSSSYVQMHDESLIPTGEKIFRTILSMENDDLKGIIFPEWYEDVDGSGSSSVLPLESTFGRIDCFFLKNPSWFIVEIESDKLSFDDFDNLSSSVRRFLTYITGIRLDRKAANVILDKASAKTVLIRWYNGNDSDGSYFYRPIPSRWGEWCAAKSKLKIPDSIKMLDAKIISICWNKFYNESELVVCLEYLLHAQAAPVDMRGALLSVALESLAEHLKKKVKFKAKNPIEKNKWKLVREKLFSLLKNYQERDVITKIIGLLSSELSAEFSEGLEVLKKRVDNLNSPTNREKLTKPFEHFKIALTEEDVDSIEKRNKFLHEGRLIELNAYRRDDSWRETYMVEMRLFTLINRLLLTYLGYVGPIINWGDMYIGQYDEIEFLDIK